MSNLPEPGRHVRLLNLPKATGIVRRNLPKSSHGPKKGTVIPNLCILNGDDGTTNWYCTPDNWEYIV